jgi:hypothetical protein
VAFNGPKASEKTGDFTPPWSGNVWDSAATGEIAAKAGEGVTLTNLTGKPSAQFYNWQPVDLPGGKKYALVCEYRSGASGAGRVMVRVEGAKEQGADLPGTSGQWKSARVEWEQAAPGKLSLMVQNYASGRDGALTVRALRVLEVGEVTAAPAATAATPAVIENETSGLPALAAASVANLYYRSILEETAALKPRVLLLDADPDAALRRFSFNSLDEGKATSETVPVEAMPFRTALRISTDKKKAEWQTHIQSFNKGQRVKKGDVLYVTAYVRALKVTDGKAEGGGRVYIDQLTGPDRKDAAGIYNGDFVIPRQWTRIHLPMIAERDLGPDDELKLMFTFGQSAQTAEFGGVAVLNFGQAWTRRRSHTPNCRSTMRAASPAPPGARPRSPALRRSARRRSRWSSRTPRGSPSPARPCPSR